MPCNADMAGGLANCVKGVTFAPRRRDAGVVDRGGLENRCALHGYLGFESLSLRNSPLFFSDIKLGVAKCVIRRRSSISKIVAGVGWYDSLCGL